MDKHIFASYWPVLQRDSQVLCLPPTYLSTYLHFLFFLPSLHPLSWLFLTLLFLHHILSFFFFCPIPSFLLFLLPIHTLSALLLLLFYASSLPFDSLCFLPLSQSFPSSFSILPSLPPQVLHPHVKTDCWWLPRRERGDSVSLGFSRLAVTASTPAQVLPPGTEQSSCCIRYWLVLLSA